MSRSVGVQKVALGSLFVSVLGVVVAMASWLFPNPLVESEVKTTKGRKVQEAHIQDAIEKFSLGDGDSIYIRPVKAAFTILFQQYRNETFVTLNIFPDGKKKIVKPILGKSGSFLFESNNSTYVLNILSIDMRAMQVEMTISKT